MDSKITGAKQGVQNMLFYYISALMDNGVKDPKQHIATEIGQMIDLSEDQVLYVESHIRNDNKLIDNLSSSIALLDNMEKTGKLDMESIKIVKGVLEIMHKQCTDILNQIGYSDMDTDNEDMG